MSSPSPTLINIGTHTLALYAHGLDPTSSNSPVILFISGIASSRLVWAAVTRLLPSSLRSYTYDRSGFGNSSPSPLAPTAENIALELSQLIKNATFTNPIILVGHSWAGILINEFLAIPGNAERVAGLVLVDANHETALQVLNPNDANLNAISEGLDGYSGRGIDVEHKLTPEEWDAFLRDEAAPSFQLQAQKEENEYETSFETLLKKQLSKRQPLLQNKPVFVIGGSRKRDWSRLYEKGVENGNGTEEQRRKVRELIASADGKSEGLMREHLKMSTRSKLVLAQKSGHFVQLTEPEVVVEGVVWVLGELGVSV